MSTRGKMQRDDNPKHLDGWWLAFVVDGKTPEQELAHAVQTFRERYGSPPHAIRLNPKASLHDALAQAAERLGLEIVADPHLPPLDYWLGPIESER